MAVSERVKVLKGARWAANTLPATRGIPILTWLLSMVGEPIGRVGANVLGGSGAEALMSDLSTETLLRSIKEDTLALSIRAVVLRLDQPQTLVHLQSLFVDVTRDNKPVDFDMYFAANYGELTAVLLWLLEENFGSFFGGNLLLKSIGVAVAAQSSTPPAT